MRSRFTRNDATDMLVSVGLALACIGAAGLPGLGCAWNYAAQPPPEEQERKSPDEDDPTVVELKDSDEESTRAEGSSETPDSGKADAKSPCGVNAFAIHFYDKTSRITKRINCAHREVVSINRTPITQEQRKRAESAGLPESTWYVLVDPKGIRSKFLTKSQLMKIQREFELQFLGRDKARNLLIYEYRGDL